MIKPLVHLIAGIFLGALLAAAVYVAASERALAQDPVKLSPERFKVLLENARVRVVDYRSHPGDKQPMHSHPDGVVYYLSNSKSKQTFPDGRTMEAEHKAGDVVWRAAVTHETENIGNTETHYIAIELKEPSPKQ